MVDPYPGFIVHLALALGWLTCFIVSTFSMLRSTSASLILPHMLSSLQYSSTPKLPLASLKIMKQLRVWWREERVGGYYIRVDASTLVWRDGKLSARQCYVFSPAVQSKTAAGLVHVPLHYNSFYGPNSSCSLKFDSYNLLKIFTSVLQS